MSGLDRRLNAYRPDLADVRLQGRVEASAFSEGREMSVAVPVADVRSRPSEDAGLDTQWLRGDSVLVFEEADGWCWAQSARDGYVGYVRADALSERRLVATHRVIAPTTFVYASDDMKSPRRAMLSLGTEVEVIATSERRQTGYAQVDGGFIVMQHLSPVERTVDDYVTVAESLERTPYLWGGTSGSGIDCSGLVQLSLRMAGKSVLRDTDMQQHSIGVAVDGSALKRGDLVFWRGHVAIMLDGANIIHANGHTMSVAREPLAQAVERIAYLYAQPVAYRRP